MILPSLYMHAGEAVVFEKPLDKNKTLRISCKVEKIKNQWQATVDLTIQSLASLITRQKVFNIDVHKFLGIYHPVFENKGITVNFASSDEVATSPFSPEAFAAGYSDRPLITLSPYANVVVLSTKVIGLSGSVLNLSSSAKTHSATTIALTNPVSQAGSAVASTIPPEDTETSSPTSSSRLLDPAKKPLVAIIGDKGIGLATRLSSEQSSSGCNIC
jgi:hypothetical protein